MKHPFLHAFHDYGMPKDVQAELSLFLGAALTVTVVTITIYAYAAMLS